VWTANHWAPAGAVVGVDMGARKQEG
jgi:hypothetical protein